MQYYSINTSEEAIRRAERSRQEAREFVERELKCPYFCRRKRRKYQVAKA